MAVIRTTHFDLQVNGNGAYAYLAEPDDNAQHPGVVVIQEWWGLEPHVRGLAERLASAGFVAAVPDLYHGKIATEPDDAQKMVMMLRQNVDRASAEIIGALEALKAKANVEPKKLGLIGFCVGGFLAYTVASRYSDLGAVVSFYGAGYDPTPAEVSKVNAPLLAIYGSQDRSVSAEQRDKIARLYKEQGKTFSMKVYDAGHAFLNPDHGAGNETAAADAWKHALSFLHQQLR